MLSFFPRDALGEIWDLGQFLRVFLFLYVVLIACEYQFTRFSVQILFICLSVIFTALDLVLLDLQIRTDLVLSNQLLA